jgi:flagellar biosynthetic protein FlhB
MEFMDEHSERTLDPTQLRLDDARRQGRVARSGDLSSALVVLACIGALCLIGPALLDALVGMVQLLLGQAAGGLPMQSLPALVWTAVWPMLPAIGLLVVVALAVAIGGNLLQVGFLAVSRGITADFSRISPAAGLQRLMSGRSAQRFVMILLKLALLAGICYQAISPMIGRPAITGATSAGEFTSTLGGMLQGLMLRLAAAMLVLAILDYLYQYLQHRRDLMISPRQMKEDLRQMEGDVLLRRRRLQTSRQRLAEQPADISRASVVITAASGLALAVRLTWAMPAPRVIAKANRQKGRALIAQASQAGVVVVQDDQLAGDLFRSCRVGSAVPVSLHEKMAEMLAYAMEISHRPDRPVTNG